MRWNIYLNEDRKENKDFIRVDPPPYLCEWKSTTQGLKLYEVANQLKDNIIKDVTESFEYFLSRITEMR